MSHCCAEGNFPELHILVVDRTFGAIQNRRCSITCQGYVCGFSLVFYKQPSAVVHGILGE
ncbi:hypothetical protein Mpsy_2990 [Methanolobus psychrophilus R15]|nr:hypothetical protein Mpsy_2990 [Methanolobus psychrophilus R15]